MAYYIRVLSTSAATVSASRLAAVLKGPLLTVESGTDTDWGDLLLAHVNGRKIAAIERGSVTEDSAATEELQEFIEELEDLKPASGAEWLREFLPRVKVIYTFQVLSGSEVDDGWSAIDAVKAEIWKDLGGIFQADAEGFSNEQGYHIVWQFSDRVSGPWWMGLRKNEGWVHFEMALDNPMQREAFLRGEVPLGVKFAT